jgi:hypothetical protein
MEWQDWLEKEDEEKKKKPTMFPRIIREFDDEKDEDPMVYSKKDVNKIVGLIGAGAMATYKKLKEPSSEDSSIEVQDSGVSSSDVNNENQTGVSKAWETWLEKNDPCWEGYEQYGMKDKEGKKVPNCVKKNNATETSHKEGEKKEEWNGKFDNSTTRDGVKDEKAESEEESLEELTDGKLEEVEKLKSWEVFLKATVGGGTEHSVGESFTEEEAKKRPDMQKKNPPKYIKSHFANSNTGKDAVIGTGKQIPTSRVGTFQDTKDTKHIGEGDVTASAVRTAKKYPELKQYVPEAQVEEDKGLGAGTRKRELSAQEYEDKKNKEDAEKFKKEQQAKGRKPANPNRIAASRKRYNLKSWELWLEKGVTYEDPDQKELDPKKIMENAKNAKTTIKLDAGMKKSWNEWLEKMQGAGDARFGNQHLTGMEQKPVADDESIDLSAESDKNNEKQEKTEDKEDKDNKPYKALS